MASLGFAVSNGITDGFDTWVTMCIVLLGITEILWAISLSLLAKRIKKEKNGEQK